MCIETMYVMENETERGGTEEHRVCDDREAECKNKKNVN